MKKEILVSLLALASYGASAQESKAAWFNSIKLSGYGITQYQYSGQSGAKANSFNIRLVRVSLEGRVLKDVAWKTQVQLNGNTVLLGSSPRIVDLFAEWQKYGYFKVKLGQFKRPFTFENPIHPVDQGFMGYAQSVTSLAGFNDRVGTHSSNGRDIGLQLQGDFLKDGNGRNLVHYQVGVFNGQGINVKDVDQRKDIIGGIWFMPVAGMRLGVFGWEGSYARKGDWTEKDAAGNSVEHKGTVRTLPQHRYAISGEYVVNDWTFRSEYIHSTGYAFTKAYQDSKTATDCNLSNNGNKADGFYVLAIAPIIKKQMHVKARYDLYRKTGEWASAKSLYEIGADYEFTKNLEIMAEYARVNDRTLAKHGYDMIDVQVSFRF
uniref:Porin n=1 Tax=Prevotella sp. GTC17253 TaxID=3236793 RepID=A0AB33ITQ1_9BACT